MKKSEIYVYYGTQEGQATELPFKLPFTPNEIRYALQADEGKMLTNGTVKTSCIYVTSEDLPNWHEEAAT